MRIITIGRSSSNDIVINDPLVTRDVHCQIIQDDAGHYYLVDFHSKNGTYINGTRRSGEVALSESDIIRIGNTTLPWQTYFKKRSIPQSPISDPPIPPHNPQPIEGPKPLSPAEGEKTGSSALGVVALIVSLAGTGLLVYCAVSIMQWGILGLISKSSLIIATAVISIIAFIIAKIAENDDKADTKAAEIAEWLSGTCVFVVVAFYLYLKFGDPDLLNPLK